MQKNEFSIRIKFEYLTLDVFHLTSGIKVLGNNKQS